MNGFVDTLPTSFSKNLNSMGDVWVLSGYLNVVMLAYDGQQRVSSF